MKILISGSSGFIGFHLALNLLACGYEVVGVDDHNDYYDVGLKESRKNILISKNFKFYNQDINNLDIPEYNFDIAINLAAQAGVRVPKEKEYLYEYTNVKGFKQFCRFCKKKNIDKIIYASSSSVYSDLNTDKFNEELTKLKPKSKYGLSKLSNENFASQFCNITNTSVIGLRFFSVYGPYGRPDMAYYSFAKAIKDQSTLVLNNNGNMSRDMTFIDDVINGIKGAIQYISNNEHQIKNEIFNIGNDFPIETKKLLETIEKKLNMSTDIKNVKTDNETFITHADITKAKNLLGYEPKVTFEDGIERFLRWFTKYDN